ncbi:MAG: preprotein translocase subunit SecE [Deltaproteobacteria bacterium]|nr:MAG: preprotein translocase subunit SecE [Deltaproteobacteria bacterium]
MKKPNQKAKKRRRSKKNTATQAAERGQKKVSAGTKAEKSVTASKPANNAPKRAYEKKADKGKQGKGIGYYVSKSIQFLRESRTELKKVKWPNRRELLASTVVVILLVLVVALFLGIVDFGLIKVIKNIVG